MPAVKTEIEEKEVKPKKNKRGHNEGTIRQRSDGTWEARYSDGKKSNGTPKRPSIYGKERRDVARQLTSVLNSMNIGEYIEPSKMTVGEWLDKWFKDYVLPTKRPSTSKGYDDIIKLHLKPHLGHRLMRELRTDHVQEMINTIQEKIPKKSLTQIANLEKKLESAKLEDKQHFAMKIEKLRQDRISPRTINHIMVMFGTSLTQAMKNGIIIKNIAKLAEKPKIEETEIEFFTFDEQKQFLSHTSSHRFGFAYEFCLATGLRQSELIGLRWEDYDEFRGTIRVRNTLMRQRNFSGEGTNKTAMVEGKPKTKKSNREIPLPGKIVEKLKLHREKQDDERKEAGTAWKESGLIFTSEIGTNIEPRKFNLVFHRILKSAGLSIRGIHSLRHSFSTRAIEAGFDIKTLSELLGHEDVSTTLNLYVHSSDDEKKKHMQKMNALFV